MSSHAFWSFTSYLKCVVLTAYVFLTKYVGWYHWTFCKYTKLLQKKSTIMRNPMAISCQIMVHWRSYASISLGNQNPSISLNINTLSKPLGERQYIHFLFIGFLHHCGRGWQRHGHGSRSFLGGRRCHLWQYRLWSFQRRDTKLDRFLGINCSRKKLPNLASCQNQFSMSKIIRTLLIFFSLNDTILGAHF